MGIIKKLAITALITIVAIFSIAQLTRADVTLWFLDGTTLKPVDSSWSVNIGAATVGAENISYLNATSDEQCLTYEATGNGLEWAVCGGGIIDLDTWSISGTTMYATNTISSLVYGTTSSENYFAIATNTTVTTEWLSISNSGNIGISSSTPGSLFSVGNNLYIDNSGNLNLSGTLGYASATAWDLTEGLVTASSTFWNNMTNIVSASSTNWDLAYGWGNHALAGYLTSVDPTWIQNGTTLYATDTISYVGIGTTTPSATLDVLGTFNVGTDTVDYLTINDAGGIFLYPNGGGNVSISTTSQSNMLTVGGGITAAGDFLMTGAYGNVNVGVTSSYLAIHIGNDLGGLDVGVENSVGETILVGAGAYSGAIGTSGNYPLNLGTNATVRMTIGSSGNVGIGTTSPLAMLDVWSPVSGNIFALSSSTAGDLLTITTNGFTGISSTTPNYTLSVGGNLGIDGILYYSSTTGWDLAEGKVSASSSVWDIAEGKVSASSTLWNYACEDKMGFSIFDATSTPPWNYFKIGKLIRDATVTAIDCILDEEETGETITIDFYEGNASGTATSSLDAAIVCGNTGGNDDGSFTNANVDAGDWIFGHTTAQTGVVANFGGRIKLNYCQ